VGISKLFPIENLTYFLLPIELIGFAFYIKIYKNVISVINYLINIRACEYSDISKQI
jgi:hypothetical protein